MLQPDQSNPFIKGPKRKRLAKACDACHRSKRRCDGTGEFSALSVPSTPAYAPPTAPCSNCFYASKQCTYTDASGRPVPAPRPFKPDIRDPQASAGPESRTLPPSQYIAGSNNQFRLYPPQAGPSSSHPYQKDDSDDEYKHSRKRYRNERGHPIPPEDLIIDGPVAGVSMDRPMAVDLDPQLTRELTNLFFTHCHPARMVIHKPTFTTELSHNKVPLYLLLSVCALAAPLSKQPRFKTTAARFAGKVFAQEALSQMFDGAGRLVVAADLAAAQALCILQMHDICTKEKNAVWSSRFHELALQIVEGLGVHNPEHPTLTPVPSQKFVQDSIEREALRRIFWLIHILDVIASIYFKKPVTFADNELKLRLPVDETSFELGVHSTLPEYLYLPPVRTQYASELGHLIRILSIYAKMEIAFDEGDEKYASRSTAALQEAEQKMEHWTRSLPDHLSWSEQNLAVQQSMFETASNTGAWCWCYIHVYHASCALVLHSVRQRKQHGPRTELTWAVDRIQQILTMLGDRAKNSILMGSALWSIVRYCRREDDERLRKWAMEYEEASGTKVIELVQDWRGQPSPPQQHLHPQSHNQAQEAQQLHQMQHPHTLSHANSYHTQPHHQAPNRRLSDVRSAAGGTYSSANASSSSSRSQTLQHDSDGSSYGANHSMKRSPSNSPPISYPYNRPSNLQASGNAGGPIRSMGMNQHMSSGLPDGSLGTNASSSASRDPRGGQGSMNMAAGASATGPSGMGHGGGNLGDSSGYQSQQQSHQQQQSFAGKYSNSSRETTSHHLRWSHFGSGTGSDSVGGGGGDGYSGSSGMNAPGVGVATSDSKQQSLGGGGGSANGSSSSGGGTGGAGGGVVGSSGNGASGQRTFGSLGEGMQSLPSLKASGLLDSWGSSPSTSRNMGSGDVPKQTSNGAPQQQHQHQPQLQPLPQSQQQQLQRQQQQQHQQQMTSPRRSTPPQPPPPGSSMSLAMLANPQQHQQGSVAPPELRPQGVAMPVGLPWLANESR